MSTFDMSTRKADVPYGTLDILILKTLDTMGPLHGYSLARRIEQVSEDLLRLSQGSVYPALIRLEQQGWIAAQWGESDNNRRAKYYTLTRAGRRHLACEADSWDRLSAAISAIVRA